MRLVYFENTLTHRQYVYGLSPVCVLRCTVRLLFCEKDLSIAALTWSLPCVNFQLLYKITIQRNNHLTLSTVISSFSSVTLYMAYNIIILLSQWLHWYDFSIHRFFTNVCPQMFGKITLLQESLVTMAALIWFLPSVCLMWHIRLLFHKKVLLHWLQCYDFSPLCILIWIIRLLFCDKFLSLWFH